VKLALALLAAVAVPARAHAEAPADPPEVDDASVEAASEANLESQAPRRGTTLSLSVGAAATFGFGIDDSTGRGGALSIRVGHVMTPRALMTFEVTSFATLHEIGMAPTTLLTNTDVNLLVGVQQYTSPSLWVRAAGGVGAYKLERGAMPTLHYAGPTSAVGIGIDIIRHHYLVVAIEAVTTGMLNRDGVLISSTLGVGVSYY
jgi:hypothetical protein